MNILCPRCDFEFPSAGNEVAHCPRCDHPVHSEIESEDPGELEPTGPDRSKVAFLVTGESVLLLDQQTVSLSLFLFGNKSFTRVRQIEQLESVKRTTCYSINSVPVYGIGLAFSEGGPFRFGSNLDDQEIHRLMSEIRRFWKS